MNKIHERFGQRRVLLPVVHCIDDVQARRAVDVAMENGADGVFLINQGGMTSGAIANLAVKLRPDVPFVGVNILDNTLSALVIAGAEELDAVWSDQCDLAVQGVPLSVLRRIWQMLFFGGVAFKYQAPVADVGAAAAAAAAAGAGIDVVTTSGPATGQPPTAEKVATMRAAIGDHALAIASGITPENVEAFLPHVDAFLVATGIEERFGVFDPGRVRALATAVHGWA
jgi:predicted TIM-barrel enzyme